MHKHYAAGPLAMLTALALAQGAAMADDYKAGDLTIKQPWARATPNGAQVAGGYMTIVNKGNAADRLVGGSIEAAATFELHEMSMEGTVMKMRAIGPLDIPAGGAVTLAPSGRHIMFTGLRHGLVEGQAVSGTLVFEHAGTVPVRFAVESIGARTPTTGSSGHADQSMPGMDMD